MRSTEKRVQEFWSRWMKRKNPQEGDLVLEIEPPPQGNMEDGN